MLVSIPLLFAIIQLIISVFLCLEIITLSLFHCAPVYNGHPWDPQKVAVVQRWLVFEGFSIKIGMKISMARLYPAVVAGGRYSEVSVNTCLTAVLI
jgi:hypothetical protein